MEFIVLQVSKLLILTLLLAGCSQPTSINEVDNLKKELEDREKIIDQQQQIISKMEQDFKNISQRIDAIVIQKEIIQEKRTQDQPYKICPNPATADDFPCVVAGPAAIPVVRGYRAD